MLYLVIGNEGFGYNEFGNDGFGNNKFVNYVFDYGSSVGHDVFGNECFVIMQLLLV